MFRWAVYLMVSVSFCALTSVAQTADPAATASCNFDTDSQVAINYDQITVKSKQSVLGNQIPYNKVWAPGGKPMTLFTNTPLTVEGKQVPAGAYTLFLIPQQKNWTLVISKSTDTSGKYNESDDLARIPMQFGQLSEAEPQFSVYLAHVAPTECNMRVDLQKARAWTVFQEKK